MNRTKQLTITAIMIALCVILPMAFHMIQNAGSIYLPMHIPVLLCGLVVGPVYGLICGLLGPVLSMLITGMPGAAYLPQMMIELGIYGLCTGLLMKIVKTKNTTLDVYISLVGAMLIGRIIAGILQALIFKANAYGISMWVTSYFITGIPGIIIQLVLIPIIYNALLKAKLIDKRY